MILTPHNCTNPNLWGKEMIMVIDGEVVYDRIFIPSEVDFIKEIYPKNPIGAKEYFAS